MKIERFNSSSRGKVAVLVALLSVAMALTAPVQAAPDVPFVADAIAKNKEAPTAQGQWLTTATVSLSSQTQPKMDAVGLVHLAGDAKDEMHGYLPLSIGGAAVGQNALEITIKRDGQVGLLWLINGKPFLGRPMEFFPAVSIDAPGSPLLFKKMDWNGATRILTVRFASEIGQPKPPVIRRKQPIGKRYQISGRLVVTNSEDGFLDNTCEINGVLRFEQRGNSSKSGSLPERPCLTIIQQDANKGFTLNFDNNLFVDHIFADPRTEYFTIRSSIYDDDAGVDDDPMSVGQSRPVSLAKLATRGENTLPGDRDSENVEVYYTITEVGDIY